MSSLRVWTRFARKYNGVVLNFRIQDLPQHLKKDFSEFFTAHFNKDEILQQAAGILKNPEAIREFQEEYYRSLDDPKVRTFLCCLDKEPVTVKDFVSAYSIKLTTKSEAMQELKDSLPMVENSYHQHVHQYRKVDTFLLKTKEMRKLKEFLIALYSTSSKVLHKYGDQQFYDDRGGVVLPEYRQLGVAVELMKVLRTMCKEEGIPWMAALMTSIGTQKGGEKMGWETLYEVNTEEFGKQHNVTFEFAQPTIKYMIDKIQ